MRSIVLVLAVIFVLHRPANAEEEVFAPADAPAQGAQAVPQETPAIRLTVRESMLAAVRNNFDLEVKSLEPEVAKQDYRSAESAFDLVLFGEAGSVQSRTPATSAFASPDVGETRTDSLSLGFKQTFKTGTAYQLSLETATTETNSNFSGVNPQYDSALQLKLTQPLLKDFGPEANAANVFVARNVQQMSRHAFEGSVMQTLTAVREAYWDMVYLQKELAVRKESLKLARDFLNRVKLQVEVGVLAPIEIISAKAYVAVREEALIGIREMIGNNQDYLKQLLNMDDAPPGSDVAVVPSQQPEYAPVKLNRELMKTTALDNRPDLKQVELTIENRERQAAYYDNQTLPTVDLQGSVTYKGVRGQADPYTNFSGNTAVSRFGGTRADTFNDIKSAKYYDYGVSIVAEYPLFNRAAESRYAKARLQKHMARLDMRRMKQQVEMEVLKSAREVETAWQRIEATRASRKLSEQKLEAEMKKFDVGSSTAFTVLEYQKDLAAEKSKEIRAVTDYLKALARMELTTGTVLANHNISLEYAAP